MNSLSVSKPNREALPLGRSPRVEVPVCSWRAAAESLKGSLMYRGDWCALMGKNEAGVTGT